MCSALFIRWTKFSFGVVSYVIFPIFCVFFHLLSDSRMSQ